MGVFEEQAKNRSDWTDQDLLLHDEATERLDVLAEDIENELQGEVTDERRSYLEQRRSLVNQLLARYRGADAS